MQKHKQKNVVIIGHSLGGSVAVRITDMLTNQEKNEKIFGCVVIDVVEGTAIQALPFMNQIIEARPKSFKSYEEGVKWSLNSGTLKKVQSARVSIPSQLVEVQKDGQKVYEWKIDLKASEKFWVGNFLLIQAGLKGSPLFSWESRFLKFW